MTMYPSGDFSWGLGAEIPGVTPAPILPSAPPPAPRLDDDEDIEDMEEDIQATVAHVTELFSALRGVLTPIFFRGLFAFLTWWVAACQLISSLFGIYFHQYLMHNWKVPWSKALCWIQFFKESICKHIWRANKMKAGSFEQTLI